MKIERKKVESKLLSNFINLFLTDRKNKGYILFYIEMSWKNNNIGLDADFIKLRMLDVFKNEIENINFSIFFLFRNKIVVVFTAINILGVSSSWKTNFENKLTKWFFVSKFQHPEIEKLECDSEKVVSFVNKTLQRMKEKLITNCVIYRHSIDLNDLEPEIYDFCSVSLSENFYYEDQLIKFFTLKNNQVTKEKNNVVINAINCYLDSNYLVFYKNVILKKVENTEGCLEFFDIKENFDIKEVVNFFKTNFRFYCEYIDINSMLLTNYSQYKEIIDNSSYYLSSIRKIEVGVEYKNGFLIGDKKFVDKSYIINVLVSSNEEYIEDKEGIEKLLDISIKKYAQLHEIIKRSKNKN